MNSAERTMNEGMLTKICFFFSLVRCVVLFVQSSSMRATLHAAEFVKLKSTCWIDNGNDDVCNSYKVNQFHGSDSDFFRLLCPECRMHGDFLVHTHTHSKCLPMPIIIYRSIMKCTQSTMSFASVSKWIYSFIFFNALFFLIFPFALHSVFSYGLSQFVGV